MPAIHFTQEPFETAVASGQLMMVDFWASWCGPCQMLAPVIDELADQFAGKVLVGKVSTEDERALAMRFGVMSIPTVIFFQNGKEIDRLVGVRDIQEYIQVINRHL